MSRLRARPYKAAVPRFFFHVRQENVLYEDRHGRELSDFFREVLDGGPPLAATIAPDREYLIEAEEY